MKPSALFALAAAALLTLGPPPASAQGLFKVVGPDGRVTYTDRAPSPSEGRAQTVNRNTGAASDPQLPFALREIASRFPATLYTAGDCVEACKMARTFLVNRGVPYQERSANTSEEREAWTRIVGSPESPTLQVGNQWLRGFVPAAWDETLTVAGYPRQSLLPPTWTQPKPLPLIAPRDVEAADRPAAPALPAPADNPSGIRF
ncbi:MAG TPA: glutaredoxin family protein [Burkholderiaceae bacterium]|nr:glutaredoxin family protein [Burkholderiaceae bacterium]